jgi:endonuclease G
MATRPEDLGGELTSDAAVRANERKDILEKAKRDASAGRVSSLVTDERRALYLDRQYGLDRPPKRDSEDFARLGQEATIGKTSDILSVEFLEIGQLAARPIGRISIMDGFRFGTGFLVGEGLLLTNHHVLDTEGTALNSVVEFNYEEHKFGTALPVAEFLFEPDRFWLTDKEFDFTLVAVSPSDTLGIAVDSFGWHPLHGEGKILERMPVNIVHHPDGDPKSISVHNSYFLLAENNTASEHYCWYTGDTREGSSGAPVFSRFWDIVALHHKAVPRINANGDVLDIHGRTMSEERYREFPESVDYFANEGIRASRLLERLQNAVIENSDHADKRDRLLKLWTSPEGHSLRRRLQMKL